METKELSVHPILVPLDNIIVSNSQHILQEALRERSLTLRFETPTTAKELKPICPQSVKNIESLIFEMFIEDQEESLRLLSLKDTKTQEMVGFIFWRNIDETEMKMWLKKIFPKKVTEEEITEKEITQKLKNIHLSQPPRHALVSSQNKLPEHTMESYSGDLNGWIKIELMCVRSDKAGMKFGSILLAAALAFAVVKEGKTHGILQVAGGKQNISAYELYKKFQFEDGKEYFNSSQRKLTCIVGYPPRP